MNVTVKERIKYKYPILMKGTVSNRIYLFTSENRSLVVRGTFLGTVDYGDIDSDLLTKFEEELVFDSNNMEKGVSILKHKKCEDIVIELNNTKDISLTSMCLYLGNSVSLVNEILIDNKNFNKFNGTITLKND